jgi:hypothetical protein
VFQKDHYNGIPNVTRHAEPKKKKSEESTPQLLNVVLPHVNSSKEMQSFRALAQSYLNALNNSCDTFSLTR